MKVLVIGGTGMVGSHVVEALVRREAKVWVLTRSEDKAEKLPKGVQGLTGNLLDPFTVRSVFNGMDSVFLLNVVSTTETHEGLMAVNGMIQSGVKRIVYLSVQDLEQAVHIPHLGSKLSIEQAVKSSGIPYTILRPNNFFQNDYLYRDSMTLSGVYPQPIGDIGISRVDVRDIADAAAVALTTSGHEGQTYTVAGPDVCTGRSTADEWCRVLGKPIVYAGNNLDIWEQQTLKYLPAWMVFDFRLMYTFFQKRGMNATASDLGRLTDLIGHAPRSFASFARETAEMWAA
ncbi:SDR family oxidoreductase [Desulfobacter sp.]|uniref:SDR family oxidoreductase n=1 Tax=Desulfobacter sp. TaxID=2294 RepID=UPI003D0A4B90